MILLLQKDQMRKIHFQQNILPHLLAVLAFLIITVLFFSPEYFDSKSLSQSDIVQWEASAQELIEYREETGKEGLWTNSIFWWNASLPDQCQMGQRFNQNSSCCIHSRASSSNKNCFRSYAILLHYAALF